MRKLYKKHEGRDLSDPINMNDRKSLYLVWLLLVLAYEHNSWTISTRNKPLTVMHIFQYGEPYIEVVMNHEGAEDIKYSKKYVLRKIFKLEALVADLQAQNCEMRAALEDCAARSDT